MSIVRRVRVSVKAHVAAAAQELLEVLDQTQKPCGGEDISVFVKQRLAAAAEEVLAGFERAIGRETERYRLLDIALKPSVILCRQDVDGSYDVQQLLVCKEEWSSSLDQEQPERPHIKEEPEDLWTSQEAEQLPGLEEGDIIKVTVSPVPVKSEDEEEKQASQLHPHQPEENRETDPLASTSAGQMETHADGEDCLGSRDPAADPEPSSEGQPLSSDCSGDEGGCTPSSIECKACRKYFSNKLALMTHVKVHSRQCGLCGKHLEASETLKLHFDIHRKCNICGLLCSFVSDLERHVQIHSEKKQFSCTVCQKSFIQKGDLNRHVRSHTGEKPFRCGRCKKCFSLKNHLKRHERVHR